MKFIICIVLCLFGFIATGQETVSMKDYVDMMIRLVNENQQRVSDIRYSMIENNVAKANAVMDKRLDGMNEFRQTLNDSNKTYVTWQALLGIIVGVSGFLFGYSNYKKNQQLNTKT